MASRIQSKMAQSNKNDLHGPEIEIISFPVLKYCEMSLSKFMIGGASEF